MAASVFLRKIYLIGLLSVFWAVFGFFALVKGKTPITQAQSIVVSAEPFYFDRADDKRRVFGKLVWNGGLVLKSEAGFFGGISGLLINKSGTRITGVTDAAAWITAELVYNNGRLSGVKNVRMGPLLKKNEKPITKKKKRDAEAIARFGDGFVVSFERKHRMLLFHDIDGRPGARSGKVTLPDHHGMKGNNGLEAIRVIRGGPNKGKLIIFAEYLEDENGELTGWLKDRDRYHKLAFEENGEFSITDVESLDDGGLIVLERRYRVADGVRMRLRYIKASDVKPGALLSGEVLFEADKKFVVDNMEGLAVHKNSQGKTILTVISDDNFSKLQKTLIMQFEIPDSVLSGN